MLTYAGLYCTRVDNSFPASANTMTWSIDEDHQFEVAMDIEPTHFTSPSRSGEGGRRRYNRRKYHRCTGGECNRIAWGGVIAVVSVVVLLHAAFLATCI